MATITPSWTDNGGTVISPQVLTRGNTKRGTIDLRAKPGAFLLVGIGRGGTTALDVGVSVQVRRTANNDARLMPMVPGSDYAKVSATAAAYLKQINNGAGYAAAAVDMVVDGTGTPAADEDLCFWGTASAPSGLSNAAALANLEFVRLSKWANGSSTITADAGIKVAKIDNEYFANKAEGWQFWLAGGCVWELVVDYGAATAGEPIAIVGYYQSYDSDQTA
jgi:hypothetical protein